MKRLAFDFQVKKKSGKNITIEGYANANTVDRCKERIDPKGWNLDNYKKNPVVLFDHGKDPAFGYMPIGKTVHVEAKEDGLYTKIQLSNSTTEKISAVRDLVEEGILKTFSVGFNPTEDTKDGDTLLITKAELIETSIVPIPMNQDSTFSVLSKRLGDGITPLARRWFDSFTKKASLVKEGKFFAALIVQRISDLEEKGDFDLKKVVDFVAAESGLNVAEVSSLMDGTAMNPSAKAVKAFAESLGISEKLLTDAGFVSLEKMRDEEPMEEEQKAAAEAMVVHQVLVPKEMFEDAEAAAGMIEQHGYKADKVSETETHWVFVQEENVDKSKGAMVDLGQGVMANVCPAKSQEQEEEKPTEEEEEKTAEEVEEEKPPEEKAAMASGNDAVQPDQNIYIELATTTNTMLGALIEEVKKMSAKLDGLVSKPMKEIATVEGEEDETLEDDDQEMKSLLTQIRSAHSLASDRLKRLGV